MEAQLTLEDMLDLWDEEWVPDQMLTRREVLNQVCGRLLCSDPIHPSLSLLYLF